VRAATAGWRSSTAPSLFLKDIVTLLPLEQTVVEIPETVQPGDCVIAACNRLKPSGYLIALDDFIPQRCAAPSLRFRQNHQDRFSDHCDRRKSRSHPPFRIG